MTKLCIQPQNQNAHCQFAITLESLLLLELVQPSSQLWLIADNIMDFVVLDNRNQKLLLDAAPARQQYTLSEFFRCWLSRNPIGHIYIVTNNIEKSSLCAVFHNQPDENNARIHISNKPINTGIQTHKQCFVSEHFLIYNGMDWTYNGPMEHYYDIHISTNTDEIATIINELKSTYKG